MDKLWKDVKELKHRLITLSHLQDLNKKVAKAIYLHAGYIEQMEDYLARIDESQLLSIAANLTVLMNTMGRIAGDLIFWCCDTVEYIEFGDDMCDVSTAMPQKKNPDPMEIMKGKSSTVLGLYVSLFTLMKAQSGTGKIYSIGDMETEMLTDMVQIVDASVEVLTIAVGGITVPKKPKEKTNVKSSHI